MTTMEELQKALVALTDTLNEAAEPLRKMLKAFEDFERTMQEEKTCEKIEQLKHKSVRTQPNPKRSKMSTYSYKPAMRRNLPYQRRNF
jgi:DNA invertase Pin-like site-specific DNA recombinase|nr:MAG TPA_asm: hypothetical protein [Caudoviricetes sp.]